MTEYRNSEGRLHREGGEPAIEWANGTREWWVNGRLHREAGLPAIERADGYRAWWVNGQRHREAGLPAIERADGTREWWVNGQQVIEEEAWAFRPPPVQGPIQNRFHFIGLDL